MALLVHRLYLLAGVLAAVSPSAWSQAFSEAPTMAVAEFNLKGVTGRIILQTINETTTSITTDVRGLPLTVPLGNNEFTVYQGLNWHIHRFPVDLTLDPEYRCLNDYVGGHYDPFMVRSNPDYNTDCSPDNLTQCEVGDLTGKFAQIDETRTTYYDTSGQLQLGGRYGVVGRSIVIHEGNGENFVCATIRSTTEESEDAEVVTLSATFIAPVGGVMYLRQVNNEHAIMFGKVFWVDGTNSTQNHNWHIHENIPPVTYRDGTGCTGDDVGPHFDPFERPPPSDPSYFCTPDQDNITNCEVGDLTGKHDVIDIAANPLPFQNEAFFFTDIFLNLTGVNAVANRSIAIHALNRGVPIIACAPLVPTEVRVALQFPDGQFQASQASPYEETVIEPMNVPSLTILSELLNTNGLCPVDRDPYDPFTAIDMFDQVTLDALPVGSLSRKHQTALQRMEPFSTTEVPIDGVSTITSRTLQSIDNGRRVCSALTPPTGSRTIVAIASFSGDAIEGNIIFIQDVVSDADLGKTNIIVDIHYIEDSQQSTSGHNWHVHQLPPVAGEACVDAIGPHFNPFDVSLNNTNRISNYSEDCSPRSPLRCESGDMSGKHGQLYIDPVGPNTRTFSYIDPSLYLSGPTEHSIIGRSIGIHAPNGAAPLLYCAEIRPVDLFPVSISLSEPESFNRVEFVRDVTEGAGVDQQSLLLKQVDVGGRSSEGATCVDMDFSLLLSQTAQQQRTADSVQSSLCDMYEDDPCLRSWPDYDAVCGAAAGLTVSLLSLFVAVAIALYTL